MKDSDLAKIKKLYRISDRALWFFVVAGITSMAIAIVGAFLVGIIEGIVGSGEVKWIHIAFVLCGFGGASSAISFGLSSIAHIWITVIEVKSESLTLRFGISAFVADGFTLLLVIMVVYGAVWWGIRNLIDSGVVGIFK